MYVYYNYRYTHTQKQGNSVNIYAAQMHIACASTLLACSVRQFLTCFKQPVTSASGHSSISGVLLTEPKAMYSTTLLVKKWGALPPWTMDMAMIRPMVSKCCFLQASIFIANTLCPSQPSNRVCFCANSL